MPGSSVLYSLLEFAQIHAIELVILSSHLTLCCSPFSFCLQSFPASGSFPVSWLFVSDGHSIGASYSASALPVNIKGWFPLGLTSLIFGEGDGTPLQYSCLENPMDRGAWEAVVHGVAKSWTRLSNFTFTFHFHALEREMATHSSILAWRIPGTGEPGGLPSMGSYRVGHGWSDLAAAAVWSYCPRDSQESSPAPQFKSINFLVLRFLVVQLLHLYVASGKTIALTIWTFVGQVMSLLFNMLSRFFIVFLPKSKHLLLSKVRILEWVTIFSSRGSSWPRDQTHVSLSPALQILYHWDTWNLKLILGRQCQNWAEL